MPKTRTRIYEMSARTLSDRLRKKGVRLPNDFFPDRIPVILGEKDTALAKSVPKGRGMAVMFSPSKNGTANLFVHYYTKPGDMGRGGHAKRMNEAYTNLDLVKTKKGLLIKNVQTYSENLGRSRFDSDRTVDDDYHHRFLDSKVGARIGLEVLKELNQKSPLHIVTQQEAQKKWGKESLYFLKKDAFWDYLHERAPEEYHTLVAKAFEKNPDFATEVRADPKKSVVGDIKGVDSVIDRYKKEGKRVPGGRLLRRLTADFIAEHQHVTTPLGSRKAKAYYLKIPREHGFKPNREAIEFEGEGRLRVLTYDPSSGGKKEHASEHAHLLKELK